MNVAEHQGERGCKMTRKIIALVAALVMALGLMTGVVSANQPCISERGNALRSVATPVELTVDDVSIVQFGDFFYVAIDHNLGDDYNRFVWREPARLGGKNIVDKAQLGFNTLYLGVAGPDGGEVVHKGQVSVYYDLGDGVWVSIIAQFNGEGEFLSVNGVTLD